MQNDTPEGAINMLTRDQAEAFVEYAKARCPDVHLQELPDDLLALLADEDLLLQAGMVMFLVCQPDGAALDADIEAALIPFTLHANLERMRRRGQVEYELTGSVFSEGATVRLTREPGI